MSLSDVTQFRYCPPTRSSYTGPAAPPLGHTAQRPVLQEAALQTLDRSLVSAEDSTWPSTDLPGVCPHRMISAIMSWVWRPEVTGLPDWDRVSLEVREQVHEDTAQMSAAPP